MPVKKNVSPRERAARALCAKAGNPENIKFEGKPMWMSYLDEVDTVLNAALDETAVTQAVENVCRSIVEIKVDFNPKSGIPLGRGAFLSLRQTITNIFRDVRA